MYKQESFTPAREVEPLGETFILPPMGVNLFYAGTNQAEGLAPEIGSDPVLLEQARERRELVDSMQAIFKKIPDTNTHIEDGVEKGLVAEGEVVDLFNKIGDFIERDENNQRIIIYLPTELLPNMNKPATTELEAAKERFSQIYLNSWERLLFESEVRASFTDGDVLEDGLGNPVRVRKAAHLIPDILEKGLLSFDDVKGYLAIDDQELQSSIYEGILAAAGRGIISGEQLRSLSQNEILFRLSLMKPKEKENLEDEDLQSVRKRLLDDFLAIDMELVDQPVSQARKNWIKGVKRQMVLKRAAAGIANLIENQDLTLDEVAERGLNESWSTPEAMAVIKAVVMLGERGVEIDIQKAQTMLEEAWNSSDEMKNELIGAITRWKRLGLVDSEFLRRVGVVEHDLSSPYPVSSEEIMSTDLAVLGDVVKKIEQDPELSEYFYPAVILFGSRIKGYAGLSADKDAAILLKPGAKLSERGQIFEKLFAKVPELRDIDKLIEFWVKEDDDSVQIDDDNRNAHILGEKEIHILGGGFWIGRGRAVEDFYGKLLKKYLNLGEQGSNREEYRRDLLGQLEFDIMQYRLLHKGYARFYPNQSRDGGVRSHLIDWDSAYWDPGFRRLATKLFTSRVFLPDLS